MRKLVVTLIEVIVSVALVYWAILMIYDEIDSYPNWAVTPALKIPFLIPRVGILVGLLMMSLYSMFHLYALIKIRPPAAQTVAD